MFEISQLTETPVLDTWHLECTPSPSGGSNATFQPCNGLGLLARGIDLSSTLGKRERIMVNLNESEAQTFQQILNGERLWSWPNGRLQLGQSFPDVTIINRLVQEGLLDQNYEPTDAGRSALQSWLQAKAIPSSAPLTSAEATPQTLS